MDGRPCEQGSSHRWCQVSNRKLAHRQILPALRLLGTSLELPNKLRGARAAAADEGCVLRERFGNGQAWAARGGVDQQRSAAQDSASL